MLAAHAPAAAFAAGLGGSAAVRGRATLVAQRTAALMLTCRAAALEHIADLSARAGATVERATAAVWSHAAALGSGTAAPLTAAAAARLDVAQLTCLAAAAVLSDAAGIGYRAALDLGFFAQIADGHAALASTFARAAAAADAALQHLAAAVRNAAADHSLISAGLRHAGG